MRPLSPPSGVAGDEFPPSGPLGGCADQRSAGKFRRNFTSSTPTPEGGGFLQTPTENTLPRQIHHAQNPGPKDPRPRQGHRNAPSGFHTFHRRPLLVGCVPRCEAYAEQVGTHAERYLSRPNLGDSFSVRSRLRFRSDGDTPYQLVNPSPGGGRDSPHTDGKHRLTTDSS
jgi:hypothetical protein